jgi:hypothetical protein
VAVIDPAGNGSSDLQYMSYYGGAGNDYGQDVVVGADGRIHLTGYGASGIPQVDPLQGSFGGDNTDAFVATFNPAGGGAADLEFSTYLGGADREIARRITMDDAGNLYVVGYSQSSDFSTTSGAFDQTYNGDNTDYDGFVVKISSAPQGTAIWRNGLSTTRESNDWDGVSFGTAANTVAAGDWRETAGAEAPTRDEITAVGDVDAGANPLIVTLTATNGTLTLGGTAGLTFGTGSGTADTTMTFVGTLPEINAALNGLTFTPVPDYYGPASIQITVDDQGSTGLGGAQVDVDTIDITVTPVNDAPVIGAQAFVVAEHRPAGTLVGTLIATDADPGDTLHFTVSGGDGAGVFQIDPASGEITLTGGVDLAYESQDTYRIRIRVEDGAGSNDWADVTVNLLNVHTPPTAAADHFAVDQNDTLHVPAGGILANDSSAHGHTLAAVLLVSPSHGTLSLTTDGSFTYTPNEGFYGTDSFTYRPTDGIEDGPVATVVIEVGLVTFPPDSDARDEGRSDDNDDSDNSDDGPDDPIAFATLVATTETKTLTSRSTSSTWTEPIRYATELPAESPLASPHEPMLKEEFALWQTERRNREVRSATDRDVPTEENRATGRIDPTGPALNTGLLWGQLDTLQEDMMQEVQSEEFLQKLVVGTTAASVVGLTVGYVAWLIRGGTLLASMISAFPAWVAFDPLPVLESFEDRKSADRRRREETDGDWEAMMG